MKRNRQVQSASRPVQQKKEPNYHRCFRLKDDIDRMRRLPLSLTRVKWDEIDKTDIICDCDRCGPHFKAQVKVKGIWWPICPYHLTIKYMRLKLLGIPTVDIWEKLCSLS